MEGKNWIINYFWVAFLEQFQKSLGGISLEVEGFTSIILFNLEVKIKLKRQPALRQSSGIWISNELGWCKNHKAVG